MHLTIKSTFSSSSNVPRLANRACEIRTLLVACGLYKCLPTFKMNNINDENRVNEFLLG